MHKYTREAADYHPSESGLHIFPQKYMDLPVPGASLSLSAHETSSPESSGVFYPAILLTSLLRLHKEDWSCL